MNSVFGYPKAKVITLTALFAILLSISSIISIPIPFSPVPITLQVLVVYLATAMLGPIFGALSCIIYVALGAVGLPVYAGATGGPAILIGPTGGYLFGFPLATFLGGLVCSRRASSKRADALRVSIAFVIVLAVIYLVGVFWLASYFHTSLYLAFVAGALPFIPVDEAKAVVAFPIALRFRWFGMDLPTTRNRHDEQLSTETTTEK